MKLFLISFLLILQASAVEPPQTYIVSRYNHLWQNSPFTDPVIVDPEPEISDLDDWVLVGLEKYSGSNYVTLVNKKDTKQRVRVPGPSELAQEFTILEIKPDPSGSTLKTEVMLQKGPHRGLVAFDSKYLTIRKAAAPRAKGKTPTPVKKPAATPPGLPGGTPKKATPTKAPRTRYIPKPKK